MSISISSMLWLLFSAILCTSAEPFLQYVLIARCSVQSCVYYICVGRSDLRTADTRLPFGHYNLFGCSSWSSMSTRQISLWLYCWPFSSTCARQRRTVTRWAIAMVSRFGAKDATSASTAAIICHLSIRQTVAAGGPPLGVTLLMFLLTPLGVLGRYGPRLCLPQDKVRRKARRNLTDMAL